MRFEILDEKGAVINTIVADKSFVESHYPRHRQVPDVPPSKTDLNAAIYVAINALEAGQLRGMREYMLTGDTKGLQDTDDKIKALRAKLEK